MRRKGARTNYPRLRGASSAARRSGPFGQFWGCFATFADCCGDGQGACGDSDTMYRVPGAESPCCVPRGQDPAHPVTNIHSAVTDLPASRAQQHRTQPPFRPTHRGGTVPPTGPPRPRRVATKQTTVPTTPGQPPEGSTIHRTGRGRKNHAPSGFGARRHRGEASGSGRRRVEAPTTGQHRPRNCGSARGAPQPGEVPEHRTGRAVHPCR